MGEWKGRIQGRRVGVWHKANQVKSLREKVVKLCLWWGSYEGQIAERLSCSCDCLLEEVARSEQGTEQNVKSHTSHQLDHWDAAELLWGRRLKGRRENLLQRNICLFGSILPLATTAVRLGAEQESAGWAGEDMAGGERENRETQAGMWQQSSEVPDEVSQHKTIYIQSSLLPYLGLCSFSLIKQPCSGLSHFENLAGKQKLQSMQGWRYLFFFLFLIFTSWEK